MRKTFLASSNLELCTNLMAVMALKGDFFPLESHTDLTKVVNLATEHSGSFILLDISDDYSEGLKIIDKLNTIAPSNHIITLTNSSDPDLVINCFRKGSDAVLYGESIFNELTRCFCTVLQGDKYVPVKFVSQTLEYFMRIPEKEEKANYFLISPREREHIKMIAKGMNSKEIAYSMKISKKTADNYRNRIMMKFNFRSVADIVKYAIRQQIITL